MRAFPGEDAGECKRECEQSIEPRPRSVPVIGGGASGQCEAEPQRPRCEDDCRKDQPANDPRWEPILLRGRRRFVDRGVPQLFLLPRSGRMLEGGPSGGGGSGSGAGIGGGTGGMTVMTVRSFAGPAADAVQCFALRIFAPRGRFAFAASNASERYRRSMSSGVRRRGGLCSGPGGRRVSRRGNLSRCAESQDASAEGHAAHREPGPPQSESGHHVGQPMDPEEHP